MNTAPGAERVEYNDIKRLDPHGKRFEVVFSAVRRLGIPDVWRTARTIFIYKKGITADLVNLTSLFLVQVVFGRAGSEPSQDSNGPRMDLSSSEGISPRNKCQPRAHRGADSGDQASKEANRGPLHVFPRLGQRLRLAPTRRALLILRLAASSGRPEADPQRHLPGKPGGIGGHTTHHRIDAIPFDNVQRFEAAYGEKVTKYRHLGNVYPFIVGSLGSWMPANDKIRRVFNISTREWSYFLRLCRLLAI